MEEKLLQKKKNGMPMLVLIVALYALAVVGVIVGAGLVDGPQTLVATPEGFTLQYVWQRLPAAARHAARAAEASGQGRALFAHQNRPELAVQPY